MSMSTEPDVYKMTIKDLRRAMTQLKPDGNPCVLCRDCAHYAFECDHNPLVAMLRWAGFRDQVSVLHAALHAAIVRQPPYVEEASALHDVLHELVGDER